MRRPEKPPAKILLGMVSMFLMLWASCETRYIERPMPTLSIDSIVTEQAQVNFYVKVETPNPCWEFSRYTVDSQDGEVLIKVFARLDKEAVCAQVIGSFIAKVSVEVSSVNKPLFNFWRANTPPLQKRVELP